MKKTIIFIQLPLINHSYDYVQGNIEYAPAAMAGYIHTTISHEYTMYVLPSVLAQFGSDSVIIKYITAIKPDIVAFTSYLWNIERNMRIAQSVKSGDDHIQVLFGGPEINGGSVAFFEKREYIDYFVIGEGEWFFDRFLRGDDLGACERSFNGNRVIIQPEDELVPSHRIFEPFTGRRLTPMLDGSMFFELTRGCPYRCAYCQYSKNYFRVRELPFDALVRALTVDAATLNLKELYILSPTLNTTGDFEKKLERLAGLKHGIRLHSEMRADGIDDRISRMLYNAGFRSMEVGLQTLNLNALRGSGRLSDPEKELRGMQCLLGAGIDLKIGLIPGLPGDDRMSFTSMVDILISRGLRENIELYPLMMLPGTAIRDRADREKINYSRKPPYYYHDGWGMSFDDIRSITGYVEDATGMSHVVRKIPDFNCHDGGLYCRGVWFSGADEANWEISTYLEHIETSVFSFYITGAGARTIERGLPRLLHGMPDSVLFNIIFYTNELQDERALLPVMTDGEGDTLYRRIHIFHEWKDGCPVRYYQVFDSYRSYEKAKDSYALITPIFHVRAGNCADLSLINDYEEYVLIGKGCFNAVKRELKKFADSAHTVAFEDESEQELFYTMTGYDYIRVPFRFRVESR